MSHSKPAVADITSVPVSELLSLKGRAAVVTGAARGLGRAIAQRLAEAGASVMIADIDETLAVSVAADIAGTHKVDAVGRAMDVTSTRSISEGADAAVAAFGKIDIWVNNAGIYPLTPALDMSDEEWDRVIQINLRGTFIGCREAGKRMDARGEGGVIINMSSTSGFNSGGPGIPHYVASKHGVNGITKQMAIELADRRIRVIGVAPTIIVTEGVMHAAEVTTKQVGFELDVQTSLLGRTGVPDDIARVVLFCASDMSIFMTGSILPVDAGVLAK